MARHSLRIVVSLLLMVVLLAVFLWNVDFTEVGAALGNSNLSLIAVAVGLALLNYWFRAVRWQLILRPAGRVRHANALLAIGVGYAAITLLPARMGDLVRPAVLSNRERLPFSATLASVLTERIFDLWTVILYFLIFIAWPPPMAELDETAQRNLEILGMSGYVVGAGLLVGTVILLGLFRFQGRFIELATRPVGWISDRWRQPVANFLNHFLDGLRVLQRPRDLAMTLGASLLLWYIINWQVKVTLMAFDLDLPLRTAYFLVAIGVLGLLIPTPGGVGAFHKAIQVGLTAFFGVELNNATAIAIVHHAICFLPITVIGLLCLPIFGVRMREADNLAEEESEE